MICHLQPHQHVIYRSFAGVNVGSEGDTMWVGSNTSSFELMTQMVSHLQQTCNTSAFGKKTR